MDTYGRGEGRRPVDELAAARERLAEFQRDVADLQADLTLQRVTAEALDGAVVATADGLGRVLEVTLAADLPRRQPRELVERAVMEAVVAARTAAVAAGIERTRSLTPDGRSLTEIAPPWVLASWDGRDD
jgi:DNA-binding protein YbaB